MSTNVILISETTGQNPELYNELVSDSNLSVKEVPRKALEQPEALALLSPEIIIALPGTATLSETELRILLAIPDARIVLMGHTGIADGIMAGRILYTSNIKAIAGNVKNMAHKIAQKKSRESAEASSSRMVSLSANALDNYIIAIGSSTGGTEALATIFHQLPAKMPGIVVVQHMPPVFTQMYAERLDREIPLTVTEGRHNAHIAPGTIHIAPGSNQVSVKKSGGRFILSIDGAEKHSGHCPSVDYMFKSVARTAGKNAIGIILTGMGADGADGLLKMRQAGAYTIGQNEKSCIVYGMPKKAMEYGAVIKQTALNDIPNILLKYLKDL